LSLIVSITLRSLESLFIGTTFEHRLAGRP